MDVAAYGLARNPFERNSELDEACLPNALAAQLSELQAGLRSPQGVSVLVGERGSGKSLLARIFARRLAGQARAALSTAPGPTLADVLAESLAQLGGEEVETRDEARLLHELGILVQRRARAGSATAIVIDDAQRLSPQVLGGLSRLFPEETDEPLHFHIFLIGRPELLDRMNASADRRLLEHLLQICRIEPLGLRDSVRYLERRLAACGGEMIRLFEAEAIDEIVAQASGRLLALETLAAGALENAARCGAVRVTTAHVEKMPAASRREEEAMALRQQSLRFEFADETPRDDSVEWGDEESEDQWVAGDEADAEDPALCWETSQNYEDPGEFGDEPRPAIAAPPVPRRGLAGMAVLTAAVFVGLTWAANRLPGESEAQRGGRDALLFAQPLTSQPREILRLAQSTAQADAAAHVVAWNNAAAAEASAADVEPVEGDEPAPAELDRPAKPFARDLAAAAATGVREAAVAPAAQVVTATAAAPERGKPEARPVAAPSRPEPTRSSKAVQTASAATPKSAKTSERRVSGKGSAASVYTVQVGAFRTRRNAQDLISKMGPRLRTARIINEGGLYRVVSGSFESKGAAVAHEGSLRRAGLNTYVRTAVF